MIAVENHYHPNDYGFEVNFWDSISHVSNSSAKMIAHCLKENQDVGQNYIQNIAEDVKLELTKLLI